MAKKRSRGEGSVRKTANGTWRGELMVGYTDDGKKNIARFSGKTKTEVLEQIREFKNQQDQQIFVRKELTFVSWANTWYEDYRSQVQPSTYAGYHYTLKILSDYFKSDLLAEMLPIHINAFFDYLVEKNYSLSQINKCRSMLIQIFDAADNNGLVVRNAARKAKVIREKTVAPKNRTKKDAFTVEEEEELRKNLPNDLLGNSIRVLFGTGIRVQELIAFTPEDIAKDGSYVNVTKAIKTVNGISEMGDPKSKQSIRRVPVPKLYRPAAIYIRKYGGKELIWTGNGKNGLYSVAAFRKRFYTALRAINGVRKLSPHCCRHTYITRLQEKGVPIEMVAKLAGHSNVETTDNYTHLSYQTLANAVEALDEPAPYDKAS